MNLNPKTLNPKHRSPKPPEAEMNLNPKQNSKPKPQALLQDIGFRVWGLGLRDGSLKNPKT